MASKVFALALAFGLAAAICPQGPDGVTFTNNTPDDIVYDVIREVPPTMGPGNGCGDPTASVVGGPQTLAAGGVVSLPQSEDRAGYSLKMAGPGGNPDSSAAILQFEWTWDSSDGMVSYDISDVNGGPDPFFAYQRQVTGDGCTTQTCAPNSDAAPCEFTNPNNGAPPNCPVTQLSFTIG